MIFATKFTVFFRFPNSIFFILTRDPTGTPNPSKLSLVIHIAHISTGVHACVRATLRALTHVSAALIEVLSLLISMHIKSLTFELLSRHQCQHNIMSILNNLHQILYFSTLMPGRYAYSESIRCDSIISNPTLLIYRLHKSVQLYRS